LNTFNICYC